MLDHKPSYDDISKSLNSKFHQQTLQAWFKVKKKPPENLQNILNEYIFLNNQITINKLHIHPKELGLDIDLINLKIVDLLDSKKIATAENLRAKTEWNTNIINILPIGCYSQILEVQNK